MSATEVRDDHLSGRTLYGDDFSPELVAKWVEEERNAYFELAPTDQKRVYVYHYHELNKYQFYNRLTGHYGRCLALGCARGDELLPLLPRIGEVVAIEPAAGWWSDRIGDTPVRYLEPQISGAIDLPDASVDIATCFGVLHHVCNVSDVLAEIARVMKPGGKFFLREPSSSQGDWRKPRRGLTRNERGISPSWMIDAATRAGFTVERAIHCDFAPLSMAGARMGYSTFNSPFWTRVDRILALLFVWNHRYWRTSIWQKFAPGTMSYILVRNA